MSQTPSLNHAPPIHHGNAEFMISAEARPVRILAEYLEPLYMFRREKIQDTVVFFGSARLAEHGPLGKYYRDARELAKRLTAWSMATSNGKRFVVCSGGGPGIMEAANRGAADAGGHSIGLNIGLPHEQRPNEFVTPELSLEFHYFFMRKLWFTHLARALIVFPGGFGTMDELFEMLTLAQTKKLERRVLVLLYGSEFWNRVVNLPALAELGMIDEKDLGLFNVVDDTDTAYRALVEGLPVGEEAQTPAIARAVSSRSVIAHSPVFDGNQGNKE